MTGPVKEIQQVFMKRGKEHMDPLISSLDSNEYVNAISHVVGAMFAAAAFIVLVTLAASQATGVHLVGFAIYGTTLVFSLMASCLLHFFLLFDTYKRILGILDHCAIYLLIAGTYTPFCLTILSGTVGWSIFSINWGSVSPLAFPHRACPVRVSWSHQTDML